jgi:signal transduction histidine kinase
LIGGVIALAIAAIGTAYAGLVLRASPQRDNRVFGALALTDAAMTAWRGINVISGNSIIDHVVTLPCSVETIVLATITIEFVASFPRRPAMRWRWRCPLWAWAAVTIVLLCLTGHDDTSLRLTQWEFFAPATLLIFALAIRAWRLAQQRDARTVIGMIGFRWAFGFSAYFIAPLLGVFEAAVWAETTVATLVSFVVIGTAVLRTELFSIRSAAAEAVTIATTALVVVLGGGGAVAAVLAWTEPGNLQMALLVGATLVPLGLAAAGSAMYPRFEKNMLAALDDRRARRLNVQGEPIAIDPDAAITEAVRRIIAMSDGAKVRWEPASALPAALVEALRDGEPRRRTELPDLVACFVVPALGGDRGVVGAFLVDDGVIDRDTYLVARDLAARVALVVERAQAVSELEDARRLAALGQFAAAIAHDIRTPLTSISLNVQILRRKLNLPADDAEHLDIALEELARLDRSVAEILDFAKPVKLASEAIDVGELIDSATRGLGAVLSERGVGLRCEPSPELAIHGDRQRLRQVLVNLVDNAADASTRGAEVTVRASAADSQVAIEVEDHGRGIGEADLKRIFEPFFTTRPDGTGLGLAIVHKVIHAHGGELKVRSTVGEGSTFTILLPAA